MMIQLNPPIEVETPHGTGQAVALIEPGQQLETHWVVFIHGSGECMTLSNQQVWRGEMPRLRLVQPPQPMTVDMDHVLTPKVLNWSEYAQRRARLADGMYDPEPPLLA